jgi:4-deoxy-L-threo-5-hexosulose-uronate ketol-isomerase
MSTFYSLRHAVHPAASKHFTTRELRDNYVIDTVFEPGKLTAVYSFHDRVIAGGCMPEGAPIILETLPVLKAEFFLQRREMGVINIGSTGVVVVDNQEYILHHKEALYIGMGSQKIVFMPGQGNEQPLYYYNSAPAHHAYPTKKVSLEQAETVELGSIENANQRTIRKLLVSGVIETCQLQMGLTELKPGSIWNTMPPHTHDRRMEVYFYFNIKEGQSVCHFMGEPDETRPLWVHNHQAVISPPWSIHAGAGTSNYSFIWGMAGENLDYSDMDIVQPLNLR